MLQAPSIFTFTIFGNRFKIDPSPYFSLCISQENLSLQFNPSQMANAIKAVCQAPRMSQILLQHSLAFTQWYMGGKILPLFAPACMLRMNIIIPLYLSSFFISHAGDPKTFVKQISARLAFTLHNHSLYKPCSHQPLFQHRGNDNLKGLVNMESILFRDTNVCTSIC